MFHVKLSILITIVILLSACENPFGTDAEVQRIPVYPKRISHTVDTSAMYFSIGEYYKTNGVYKYWSLGDNFKIEKMELVIDSTANPYELSVKTYAVQQLPQSYLNRRNYIVESISLEIRAIPIVKSVYMYGYNLPMTDCTIKIREVLTGSIYTHRLRPDEVQVIFPMLDPYIIFSVYIDIRSNLSDELERLQLDYNFEIEK